MRMLTPKCPQQPQLVTLQAVNARRAILGPADMNGRGIQTDLLDELADPQCMPEGREDQQPVADRVAALARAARATRQASTRPTGIIADWWRDEKDPAYLAPGQSGGNASPRN